MKSHNIMRIIRADAELVGSLIISLLCKGETND
jgi:hypothetical protein